MNIKSNWKRNIVLMIAFFAIIISTLAPSIETYADLEEANREFDKKSAEFFEDADEAKDIAGILDEDNKANPNPDRNSISYVMKRLLYPGVYVNNVKDGVMARDIDKDKDELLVDGKYACDPEAPNNLLNHNCNIPNFTTGAIQNVAEPFTSPFSNAGRSSSYSVFGLGVPKNIPGGEVPINPENRNHAYTALELYGYNLPLTSYDGEWDQIVVSNEARMLSNFGVIDSLTLAGTTLFNTATEGVASFIENFSFNPVRWFGTAAKSFGDGASAGVNTVVDTSELNIVATNEWKRPNLDDTLYDVYVMSDKEVLQETARNYFTVFTEELEDLADSDSELGKVLERDPEKALDGIKFNYDPNMETKESKEEREAAKEKRAEQRQHNKLERYTEKIWRDHLNKEYEKDIIDPLKKIPSKEYYTESEQLEEWAKKDSVKPIIDDAASEGLISKDISDYDTFKDLEEEWQKEYSPYMKGQFDAQGDTIKDLLERNDSNVFQKHPYLDPKQGISRYACTNEDGSIKRQANGMAEYLYTKNNDGEEHLNPECDTVPRPPIGGGLLGTGWEDGEIDDTRHISNVSGENLLLKKISNVTSSAVRSLNSLIAKITNVILGLSFSPLIEELGIDEIVEKLVKSFRDTVFFPLAGLAGALGALLIFFQLLKNGSAWQLLGSIAMTFIIFVAGATFLLHPSATLNLVDSLPSKVDNIVADAILNEGDDSSYCSTGEDTDGVRSAQCNVWGAIVFEPWVHLQFGTGYDNLFSKGNAPSGSLEMQNKNEELVGDASVDMGNGKTVNNWAMYQLDKTKAGTINKHDSLSKLSNVDKDLYRLVDLQAGPENGKESDDRYFEDWSGGNVGGFYLILTTIQAILMAFAIGGLGIAKIEVSFMFSISLLFLPFMLLYALLPKGRIKLKGYLANLISLLVKRAVIVVMLAVLLRVIVAGYSKADTLMSGALMAIFISIAFMLYRKELLEMITKSENGQGLMGGDTSQVKEALGGIVPKGVKQASSVIKSRVKGTAAGFVGGAVGASQYKAELRARKTGLASSIAMLNAKKLLSGGDESDEDIEKREDLRDRMNETESDIIRTKGMNANKAEKLNEERIQKLEEANSKREDINKLQEQLDDINDDDPQVQELEARIVELSKEAKEARDVAEYNEKMLNEGERSSGSLFNQGLKGASHSGGVIGKRAERRIRSEGYAPLTSFRDVQDTVYSEGAKKITSMDEEVEHDVYKEVMSHSEKNKAKSSTDSMDNEDGQLRQSPKVQKKVREIADERRKAADKGEYDAITEDPSEMEKAARIVDRRRSATKARSAIINPVQGIRDHKKDLADREDDYYRSSETKHTKKFIDDDIEKGIAPDETKEIEVDGENVEVDVYYDRVESDRLDRENTEKQMYEREKKVQEEKDKYDNNEEEVRDTHEEMTKEDEDNDSY